MDKKLVDDASDAYIDWREESAGVRTAYDRWVAAPMSDAVCAFAAYRAAVDREEFASRVYADLVARTGTGTAPVPGLFGRRVALHR